MLITTVRLKSLLCFILFQKNVKPSLWLCLITGNFGSLNLNFCLSSPKRLSKVLPVPLSLGNINSHPILRIKNALGEINNDCRISSYFCAQNLLYRDFVPSRSSCLERLSIAFIHLFFIWLSKFSLVRA